MPLRSLTIETGEGTAVSGALHEPPGERSGIALVLAHGAGGDMNAPLLVGVATGLAERGHAVLRFNFPYKEQGKKAPDPAPKLEAPFRAAVEAMRAAMGPALLRLVVGGKSLGGRVASLVVAAGMPASGLVFLGYPLHAPGKKKALRDKHLEAIRAPMLFVQGTRDPLCDLALLRPVLAHLSPRASMHVVEGGDHSLDVPKSHGRTREDVQAEVVEAIDDWLRRPSAEAA